VSSFLKNPHNTEGVTVAITLDLYDRESGPSNIGQQIVNCNRFCPAIVGSEERSGSGYKLQWTDVID
jgi:hypothetical protein